MQFFKKHMKQLGTIVTLLALFFVVWKMVTMDVDYGAFATPRAMAILVLSILLQALIFCYMTFPWLHLDADFIRKENFRQTGIARLYKSQPHEIHPRQCLSVCCPQQACQ